MVDARAIVVARDARRESLESMARWLNSEIDLLARQLAEEPPNDNAIFETLQILQRVWPGRMAQIELEARKLLITMGVDVFQLERERADERQKRE
jgi:hypothetical protein